MKGASNIADPLSRLEKVVEGLSGSNQPRENTELYVRQTVLAVTAREVEQTSFADEEFSYIREVLTSGNCDSWPADILRVYHAIRDELCVIGKLVLRGSRIVVPRDLRSRML